VVDNVDDPIQVFICIGIGDDFEPESKRVPTFYAGKLGDDEVRYTYIAGGLVAMIFGAVHCIAWSFQYPSYTEQMLWRLSSIAIVCLPVFYLVMWTVPLVSWDIANSPEWLRYLLAIIAIIVAFLYGLARAMLLVLALMSFRSLPAGAYQTVSWTTYIPHV
jgi:hypothetical protein